MNEMTSGQKLISIQDAEATRSKLDKRIYELDTCKTILLRIDGLDYRYSKTYSQASTDDEDSSIRMDTNTLNQAQMRTFEGILTS